jgi:hypothetical protein
MGLERLVEQTPILLQVALAQVFQLEFPLGILDVVTQTIDWP